MSVKIRFFKRDLNELVDFRGIFNQNSEGRYPIFNINPKKKLFKYSEARIQMSGNFRQSLRLGMSTRGNGYLVIKHRELTLKIHPQYGFPEIYLEV